MRSESLSDTCHCIGSGGFAFECLILVLRLSLSLDLGAHLWTVGGEGSSNGGIQYGIGLA